ncbi:MAG: GNAT family N-acetyltransferase [Flavobacteriales bacterium]
MDPLSTTDRSSKATSERGTYRLIRTDPSDPSFRELVTELDKDLAIRDGKDHAFFAQFNGLDHIKHVVIVLEGTIPMGCGAIKVYSDEAMEIKRMFVPPAHRQKGIASLVLRELECWALELGYRRCVLETGQKQPEAIALYTERGYSVIPNYGQYIGVESSVCFEKRLPPGPTQERPGPERTSLGDTTADLLVGEEPNKNGSGDRASGPAG